MSGTPRLPGSLLQRLAQRLAPPAAREHVLLPIVADLQHEHLTAASRGRRLLIRLRGTAAFARALAPILLRTAAGGLWRGVSSWNADDGRAARRLLTRAGLAASALTALLWADGLRQMARYRPDLIGAAPLLLAGILPVTLPAACLLGVALAAPWRRSSTVPWRPILATALVLALATFLVGGWLTPNANQAYRQRVFQVVAPNATVEVARGDRELTLPVLQARHAELTRQGRVQEAAAVAVEWHKKPAMAASCLTLALVGVALARAFRRPVVRVLGAMVFFNVQYALLKLGEQGADTGRLSPALAMWAPAVVVLALAAPLPRLTRCRPAVP